MKHKNVRIAIFILALFGAITAIAGGIGLLTGAISPPLDTLQGSPFVDYTVPGLALTILVGGSMLLTVTTIFTGREVGILAAAFAGLTIIGFEVVEVIVVDRFWGSSLLLALSLQVFYFVFGITIFGLATFLWEKEFYHKHSFTQRASHT